jgi:hypothetical protein
MKKMMFCGIALMFTASIYAAEEGRPLRSLLSGGLFGQAAPVPSPAPITPVPDPAYSTSDPPVTQTIPMPDASNPIVVGQPIQLFEDVRYRAVRNIAPCAIPTIIQVADPCNKSTCCKNCVCIEVCMPPCEPNCVKVSRDGNAVRYDFGKYAVTARTVGNHIVVRYHD